jgi:hypothetical protein
MGHSAAINVPLELSSMCLADGTGKIVKDLTDLRLVHADDRADDGGCLSASDPRLDPARDRARVPPTVLRPDAGWRSVTVAAFVFGCSATRTRI